MNYFLDPNFLIIIAKLSLAMILGLLLGLERIYAHKTVGLRTYALVCISACFFIIISLFFFFYYGPIDSSFNPAYIAGSIISGIGFLGAGLIIFNDNHIQNLTTAAGLWVCAGIGIACGFGMFRESIFLTILAFFVLAILSTVERRMRLKFFPDPKFQKEHEKQN